MLASIKKFFRGITTSLNKRTQKPKKRINAFITARPFATLFTLLGILLLLIILSNFIRRPPAADEETKAQTKNVDVYRIGAAPRISVQAQVEKSGVVTITALSPGVVQHIFAEPGTRVNKGTTLLTTSTNYQGGNVLALQSSLAARQLQNVNETYQTQKDLIQKQKDIANKSDENSDELRDITNDSLEETRDIIEVNDDILQTLNENLEELEANNTDGANDQNILTTRTLRSQFLSANAQLRSGLRNAEYSGAGDNPPAELSDIQKEVAIKQLEIQEKALDLSRDVSRLQLQLAQIQEATMYPSSPFNATVQRVNVKVGQAVQPGTPLMVLSQVIEEDPIVAIAYVPREIARKVSYFEPSKLSVGDFIYEAYPSYVTQDAIKGTLYGIYYPIPDNYHQSVTDTGYINVEVPVGHFDTGISVPFVPIDSVYQTEEASYLFITKNGKAESRKVTLGPVIGRYVQVEQGLTTGDVVILNRDIVAGDNVKISE